MKGAFLEDYGRKNLRWQSGNGGCTLKDCGKEGLGW